jgi:hypothetical protein
LNVLEISLEKICFVIIKAREFDVPEDVVEEDPGSNPIDEGFRDVLAAYGDDPTYAELKSFIEALNEDEQADLVALMWLGRGDYTVEDWDGAVTDARDRHTGSTADYLLGTPLLPDLLTEGMGALGLSCEPFEAEHL